jgi:hypothetical protein
MASGIQRIEKEFVLKEMVEKRTPVEVHIREERLTGRLSEFGDERIVVVLPDDIFPSDAQQMSFYFRFRNNPMTFTSAVIDLSDERAEVKLPAQIFRDLNRSFERIKNPRGVSVSFLHKGQTVQLDYPDSDQFEPVDDPGVEPGFDPSQIAELLKNFRERAAEFASDNKIVMFRERKPESFQERIVARTGRVLVLPFYGSVAQVRPQDVRERILEQDDVIATESDAGRDMFDVLEEIGGIVNRNKERNVYHELYCPILYHQYVIGYMQLVRGGSDQTKFAPDVFEFVIEQARVLSYSLKMNGYFKSDPRAAQYGASEILDISGSGALFGIPAQVSDILLFTDLDMRISFGDREVPVRGRVMRKSKDTDRVYLAIQFMEFDPDDHEQLLQYIYGPEYRGDVDTQGVADARNLPVDEI